MHFNPKEQWGSTEEGRRKLVKAFMNNSLGASVGVGVLDPKDLPRRYLSPGTLGGDLLYVLFFLPLYLLVCETLVESVKLKFCC